MRVTIGIPFYNAERTLADAIRSVFTQTFHDWELLLVDDGSTEGSLAIAQAVQDSRVRVCSDGQRRGLANRLNQIAQSASGEYLARMDADDLMHPERLARQLDALRKPASADLAASAVYVLDDQGGPARIWGDAFINLKLPAVLRRCPFVHPTITGKTSWFRANPYDPAYARAEDHELWCRTCDRLRAVHLPQPLLFYRQPVVAAYVKFCESYATDRKIFRTYSSQLDRTRRARFVAASYCKTWLRACSAFSGVPLPARNRRRLTAEERIAAARDLRTILSTPVPGLAMQAA